LEKIKKKKEERDELFTKEFDLAQARFERDEARHIAVMLEAWVLFESGGVPDEIKMMDWWDWDWENEKYHEFLAMRRGWLRFSN